jgi:hypothetical protein
MRHYYRLADVCAQIVLVVIWATAEIVRANWLSGYCYVVGGWYVLSLAIHFIISSNKFQRTYRNYAFACIVLIILPLYGLVVLYVLFAEMYFLPFVLPILALMYTVTCIAEIMYLHKRPISYIK